MIGKTLAHYEIIGLLGKGGMGEVYRAQDTKLEREVALKVLPAQMAADPERNSRFAREARAVAAMNHPNIVTIYSVEEDFETPFLTMELVPGTDLSHHIPEGGIPVDRLLTLGIQMAEALAAANELGITHRDLKPGNIMITPGDQVKLLDFGLAKLGEATDVDVTARHNDALTRDGTILGTVAYMSPEQLEGRPADHRSDLFALGIILYQMATGTKPYRGVTHAAVMTAILRDEPAPASQLRPGLPSGLDAILASCLQKNPDDRCQSASELSKKLESLSTDPQADTRRVEVPESQSPSREPAIAVLPFTDLSQHGDQDYFCDGMTEEILAALTAVQGIRVAARTSSARFKGQNVDVREVGRALNVDLVLEGSIRLAGNRLRVTAQLIKVTDGYNVWSERYSRLMEDVFEIQDEISAAIASALETTIGAAGKNAAAKRHSENVDAYHLYLRGRHCWNRRHQGVLPKAIEYFRQAIDTDPEYALAYSGLADCYNVLGFYGFERPELAFQRAIAAATRALDVDPDHAEALTSLAYARQHFDWNLEAADQGYRRAKDVKPGYEVAHQWHALAHVCRGEYVQARKGVLRARELDPLSPTICTAVGWVHYLCGDNDIALRELGAALEVDPGFAWLSYVLGHAHLQAGHASEAEQFLRKSVEATDRASFFLAGLGHSLGASGRSEDARAILEELQTRGKSEYVPAEHIAAVQAGLGDADATMEALQSAIDERSGCMIYAAIDPQFALVHDDPRFSTLRERMAEGVRT